MRFLFQRLSPPGCRRCDVLGFVPAGRRRLLYYYCGRERRQQQDTEKGFMETEWGRGQNDDQTVGETVPN